MVSACLITYGEDRRPNVARIVDHLLRQPFIGEVLIRDHMKMPNVINYGRYLAAHRASYVHCYTQDDDVINHDLPALYEAFLAAPDRIAFGLGPRHWPQWEQGAHTYGTAEMGMAGFGMFFQSDWIPVLDRYTRVHGFDPTFYRETDRIFTLLRNMSHTKRCVEIEELDGAYSATALWKQPDHSGHHREAVQRCLAILKDAP